MKVTKMIEEQIESYNYKKVITNEDLQMEFDYFRAEKLLKAMLEKGIINAVEFNKITNLNRQAFSPFLAEIMPLNR